MAVLFLLGIVVGIIIALVYRIWNPEGYVMSFRVFCCHEFREAIAGDWFGGINFLENIIDNEQMLE